MKLSYIPKTILSSLIVVTLLTLFGFINRSNRPGQAPGVISLRAPSFISLAQADTAQPPKPSQTTVLAAPAVFTDTEIGLAAYFNAGQAINLSNAAAIFRTLEIPPDAGLGYILGSVPVTSYTENHDTHVYIHQDGWVMAYYRKTEPAGKIFRWLDYDGGTVIPTKLEDVLGTIATTIGAPVPTPTYYHFSYPDATNLMLIAQRQVGGDDLVDSFTITLPGSFIYYERSWSLAESGSYTAYYFLNGTQVAATGGSGGLQGQFAPSELGVDTIHTIGVSNSYNGTSMAGLALIYKEQ